MERFPAGRPRYPHAISAARSRFDTHNSVIGTPAGRKVTLEYGLCPTHLKVTFLTVCHLTPYNGRSGTIPVISRSTRSPSFEYGRITASYSINRSWKPICRRR